MRQLDRTATISATLLNGERQTAVHSGGLELPGLLDWASEWLAEAQPDVSTQSATPLWSRVGRWN